MRNTTLWLIALTLLLTQGATAQMSIVSKNEKSTSIVTIAGESYYVHTVKAGETFFSLEKLYQADEATIRRYNPQVDDGLKSGQVLKIPMVRTDTKPLSERKMRRLYDTHTVNAGETAYSIAKRYGIGIDVLLEDNPGFDPAHLSIGQQINIRKSSQGTRDEGEITLQIESYKDALDQVSEGFVHHLVGHGDTLYGLGKKYAIPVDTILRYNDALLRDGLKEGSILKLPVPRPLTAADSAAMAPKPQQPAPVVTTIKSIDLSRPIKVALLLPLKGSGINARPFIEFYQGALLALEELKEEGVSAKFDLFNTARSTHEVESVLKQPELAEADLIIGPVYDTCMPAVAAFSTQHGIPTISPLGTMDRVDQPLLYEAAPSAESKNEKLRRVISDSANVIVISTSQNDSDFSQDITAVIPKTAQRMSYSRGMTGTTLQNMLSSSKPNVIVVLSSDEMTTDGVLAYIGSARQNFIARGTDAPTIRVIGSSRWARFSNIEKDLFFKLNVHYITTYHADRGNQRVMHYDGRYIAEYKTLPSLYAYRGYDVTKLFVGLIHQYGSDFSSHLNNNSIELLQTPYHFVRKSPNGKYTNDDWAMVCFNTDYTISVE